VSERVVALSQRWRQYTLYLLVAVAAVLALFGATASWPDTPDGLFHLHRVRSLAEALQAGVLYPRWFPDFAFGYGYPVLNYYAPAFYYAPALLHLLGLDVLAATRLSLALWYGASALTMVALLRCWTRPTAAIFGALLYLVFPYRLYDLFVRGALPEFVVFTWLPLLAFFNYRLITAGARGEGRGASRTWFLLTALAWAGLILTHNLTALMTLLTAGILILLLALLSFFSPFSFSPSPNPPLSTPHSPLSRIHPIALPLLAGLGLSAFQLAPSLLESGWVMLGAAPGGDGYLRHLADWGALATAAWLYPYPDAAASTVPLPGYLVAILALALLALLFRRKAPLRTHLLVAWVMSVLFVLLTTAATAPIWSLLAPVLGKLQFPWRWQTLLALTFAVVAATLLEAVWAVLQRRRMQLLAVLAGVLLAIYGVVYAVAGLTPTPAPFTAQELTADQMWVFDAGHGQIGATWTAEFLPRWVREERWTIGREPAMSHDIGKMESASFAATPIQQQYLDGVWRMRADAPFSLRFHRFYFPAWRVTVDGRAAVAYADGALGLLAVDLDAGEHLVQVQFAATPALWFGLFVSGASILALALVMGKAKWNADDADCADQHGLGWDVDRREPEWNADDAARADRRRLNPRKSAKSAISAFYFPILAAAVLIVVLVAVNLNLTAKTTQPLEIGADYGAVRLEAAMVGAGAPGAVLSVRLDWSMLAPQEPLTTFVHVVDAEGRMAAQKDEPLAGRFTPFERWQPGLIMNFTHHVSLPADLAPGVYTIYVGLYPMGRPEAPLQPLNRPDARIEIGSVEVAP
jgi:hypothetical protein